MPTSVARQLEFSRDTTFEKHQMLGRLGTYLTEKWKARFADSKTWVMWDLTLVQALLLPNLAKSKLVTTPPENAQRTKSLDVPFH